MDLKDVFKEIYLKKMWCPENEKFNFKFYSGSGSHYPEFVLKYLKETSSFLCSLNKKPDVVDLGCGDFAWGSLIYDDLDILYTGYDAYKKVRNLL